jgi:hypothetical protein
MLSVIIHKVIMVSDIVPNVVISGLIMCILLYFVSLCSEFAENKTIFKVIF